MRNYFLANLALSAVIVALALPLQSQDYVCKTIGSLGGGRSQGFALNASGQVVGSSRTAAQSFHAFRWSQKGGMQDLGNLPGANFSVAKDINNSGDVVGCSVTPDVNFHVFLWTEAGGMEEIGSLFPSVSCEAISINNSGQVVWWDFNSGHAVRWTRAGGVQDLGFDGFPTAINEVGQIAGSIAVPGGTHAFLWSEGAGLRDLGTLNSWPYSSGSDLNDSAEVVGLSTGSQSDSFIWNQVQGMQGLHDNFFFASSINNHSQVVGSGPFRPIWDANLGVRSLVNELPKNVRYFHAWENLGINDAGQVVVTDLTGTPGNSFLLTPRMKPTLASSSNPSHVGQPVTLTATISSVQGAPPDGEKVAFRDGARKIATVPLKNGLALFTTSALANGTHAITAEYAGDVNFFKVRSAPVQQVVNLPCDRCTAY